MGVRYWIRANFPSLTLAMLIPRPWQVSCYVLETMDGGYCFCRFSWRSARRLDFFRKFVDHSAHSNESSAACE
jgi:hypothetical protein